MTIRSSYILNSIVVLVLIRQQTYIEALESEASDVPVEESPAEPSDQASSQRGQEHHQVPVAREAGAEPGGPQHYQRVSKHRDQTGGETENQEKLLERSDNKQ